MTKSGNYAKKLLAVSAGVALLGGIALTGFAGTDLFKASAEGDEVYGRLALEEVDALNTDGYKIEKKSGTYINAEATTYRVPDIAADDFTTVNVAAGEGVSYDYIFTINNAPEIGWQGKMLLNWSTTVQFNITAPNGNSFQNTATLNMNYGYKSNTKGDIIGDGITSYKSKNYTTADSSPSFGGIYISDITGFGECVLNVAVCDGSLGNANGCLLRVLIRSVEVQDHEFSFTGASVFDEDNPNVMFLNFGSDVLGVSTADESWNHAQRFMSTTLPFFQKIYFLEKGTYDITAEGAVAPTAEQLAGNDLYSLMTGENDKADGLLFETHLRHDHIELGLLAREGAGSQEGSKVNYKAGDVFYLAEGLEMLGKDANTNWCIASEGGSKNILANNQLYWFDGESWSSDEFSVTLTIDKTKAKAEVDGATDTIAATLVTGKLASEAGELTVTWTSSDEAVATVENGVVTGVSAGTAIITASLENGSTKTCTVTVVNADEITGIKLNKSNNFTVYTSGENNTFQLTATVEGGSKAPQTVTWTIADNTIATVDENGLVTGLKAGSTKITCTAADGTTTATVNVNVK